jgi:hypothetical protein
VDPRAGLDVVAKKVNVHWVESNCCLPARSLVTKRKDVREAWRKFHNEELNNLYSSQNNPIIRAIKKGDNMGGA